VTRSRRGSDVRAAAEECADDVLLSAIAALEDGGGDGVAIEFHGGDAGAWSRRWSAASAG
jgi:hypothetical protein